MNKLEYGELTIFVKPAGQEGGHDRLSGRWQRHSCNAGRLMATVGRSGYRVIINDELPCSPPVGRLPLVSG